MAPARVPRTAARIAVRSLWVAGALVLAVFVAVAGLGYGDPQSDLFEAFNTGLYLVPAALCALRALLVKQERIAWALFAFGMASWAARLRPLLRRSSEPREPALPIAQRCAVAHLLRELLCRAAGLMRSRLRNFRRSLWIDALVGGLALAA